MYLRFFHLCLMAKSMDILTNKITTHAASVSSLPRALTRTVPNSNVTDISCKSYLSVLAWSLSREETDTSTS